MRIRITAIRKASYPDLMVKYENPIEHSCDVTEGQEWISIDGRCPEGMCPSACCAIRLLPVLVIPTWLWIWAGIIITIKIINQISALVVCKRFCFPHTLANKLTGFLLFLTVPAVFCTVIPVSIVAALATFAALQEGHYIRTWRL